MHVQTYLTDVVRSVNCIVVSPAARAMEGVEEEEGGGGRGCREEEEEKEGCEGEEVVVRPENISSTVVIKKADALMSPFSQLQQVNCGLVLTPI